ncbi:MAG: adenylate/guanylate cyclase domain-containing protein [Flectobacillus sp.]|uniref:adenylate/guanylate cyclase domain-containing protein n=1 Tax=Flectobacillus sp. TaxID=50419 RepID=UPI003B9A4440
MKTTTLIRFCAIWLFFNIHSLSAQNKPIELWKNRLLTETREIPKIDILLNLSKEYELDNNLNESLAHAQQALSLSEKANYKKGMAFAYLQLSLVNGKLGNKSTARKQRNKANDLLEEVNQHIGNDIVQLQKQQLLAEEELKKDQEELALQKEEAEKKRQELEQKNAEVEQSKGEIALSLQTINELSGDISEKESMLLKKQRQLDKQADKIKILRQEKALQDLALEKQKVVQKLMLVVVGAILLLVLFLLILFFNKQKSNEKLAEKNEIIEYEKHRSDELLLNILPSELVEELKEKGTATTRYYESATVMFTDFKGFTQIAEQLSPQELIEEIDYCFKGFDLILEKYSSIEKIKTIGDAYLCAGGIPMPDEQHPIEVIWAAWEILAFMKKREIQRKSQGKPFFEIRIGIHSGPLVAGVVGVKKFAYDIWGDTVNTASRMESKSEVGKINISGSTYQLIKSSFECHYRGKIQAKNKGEIDMYFIENPIK